MKREYEVTLMYEQRVRVVMDAESDAITRITGVEGDEWRGSFYPLYNESEVFTMWADNAVRNGITDASVLDGWVDLGNGEVVMRVIDSEPLLDVYNTDVYLCNDVDDDPYPSDEEPT